MRLLNRRNMRINLAKRTARKRYLVYTTDDFGKAAVDPTRVFASPQPQNRHFRVPVEKVGLVVGYNQDTSTHKTCKASSRYWIFGNVLPEYLCAEFFLECE